MEGITTVERKVVPLRTPEGKSLWVYTSFFVVDLFSPKKECLRCGRSITYVYEATHPQFGKTQVGMECITQVLSDESIKVAMSEFRKASCSIVQARLKNRIKNIRARIPRGILEVLKVNTNKGPMLVKEILEHFDSKLELHLFLSSHEVKILRTMEARV